MFDFIYNIDIWIALFFIIGFLLVIIEIFNPGFGIPGALGAIFLVIGVVLTMDTILDAIIMIVAILIVLAVAFFLAIYSVKKGLLSRTIVLTDSLDKESGFQGTEDLKAFLGKEGIALTALRPAGTAEFNGTRVDVVSEFDYIEKDSKVKVIDVEGRRVVVRKIK
ncbi:MAG TPA: NfeD family protein [Acetivibrio sp.]|nr:NfeD family protein [Acetivibrio sp.]